MLVPETLWQLIHTWYGGGPVYRRAVIPSSKNKSTTTTTTTTTTTMATQFYLPPKREHHHQQYRVELHPLVLSVCLMDARTGKPMRDLDEMVGDYSAVSTLQVRVLYMLVVLVV